MPLHVDPNTKGLIFDLDGTLADTMSIHFRACQKVGETYGFDFPLDYFLASAGRPTTEVFELLLKQKGLIHDAHVLAQEKEDAYVSMIDEVKPMALIAQIVEDYAGKLPMSIGTGSTRDIAEKTLNATGLAGKIDIIVTADDVINTKPAPDTFLLCAKKMDIASDLCQVFEDGQPGLDAAITAGMIATDVRPYTGTLTE